MAGRQNYTFILKAGEDGTQYLLIRKALPPHSRLARQGIPVLAEGLTMLRIGFQKALKLASRRA